MVAATKSSPVCLGMEIVMSMNIALRACTVALIIVLAADLMPLMTAVNQVDIANMKCRFFLALCTFSVKNYCI